MDYSTVTAVCTAKLAKENAQKIAEVANTMVAQADVDALRKAAFESYTQLSRRIDEGGGGGGTTDYNKLTNKPKLAGKELTGNTTLAQLNIATTAQLEEEKTARVEKDNQFDAAIATETGQRETKDNELAASIANEQTARVNKDNDLLGYIGSIADLDTEDKTSTVNAINSLTNTLCDLDTFVMKGRSTYSSVSNVMMSTGSGDKKTYFDIGGGFDLSRVVADSNSASYITFDFPNGCYTYIQSTADQSPLEVGIYLDSETGTKLGTAWVNFTTSGAVYPTNISHSVPKPKFPTIDAIYPVGSVYISMLTSFDPNTAWTGTTWTKIKTGLFLEASDTAGTEIEAGLPNITGYIENNDQLGSVAPLTDMSISCRGAFNWNEGGSGYTIEAAPAAAGSGTCLANQIYFNAGKSNPIYGNSITVQPNSITVVMWQRTA